jgi:uncharacterized protein
MSEFAVILKPVRDNFVATVTADEALAAERHFAYFASLQERGKLKYAGRCEDGYLGIGIFEAASEQEVERLMQDDPALRAGVMSATIKQWRTALSPPGW